MKFSGSLKLAALLTTTVFFAPVSPATAQPDTSAESQGTLPYLESKRDEKEAQMEEIKKGGRQDKRPTSGDLLLKDPSELTDEEREQLRRHAKAGEERLDAEIRARRMREEAAESARLAQEAEDRARRASQEAEYRARRLKDHPAPTGMSPNRIDVVVNPDGSVEHIYTGYKITVAPQPPGSPPPGWNRVEDTGNGTARFHYPGGKTFDYAPGQQANNAQAQQTTSEEDPQRSISTPTTQPKAATDGTTETKPRSASAQKRDHGKTSRKSAKASDKPVRYGEVEPARYEQQRVAANVVSIGLGVGMGMSRGGFRGGGMHGGGMHAGRVHGGGHAMGRMR